MAGPELSLEGFLASSAPLEVQLNRARNRVGSEPAFGSDDRKSFLGGSFAGKGNRERTNSGSAAKTKPVEARQQEASRHKRHTVGTFDEFKNKELAALGLEDEDKEDEPTRSFWGSFFGGGWGRKKSEGDMSEVLKDISTSKYVRNQTLWDALENQDTVLIKGSWLVRRWKLGKKEDGAFGLPRRQELQERHPAAVWKVNELMESSAKGKANIVAVSHCWLGSQHPDPQGTQLDTLCQVVDLMLKSTPLDDLALFIDWCSLYQHPRNSDQEAAFTRALPLTHLWYLHQGTRVWMLTKVNPKMERNEPYEKRGWPILEQGLADMVTKSNFLLDLGKLDQSCNSWQKLVAVCRHARSVPLLPEEFNEELERAVFAVEEDRPFVSAKYDEGFLEAIAAAEELTYSELGWGDEEAALLARVLPHCPRLNKLALHGNKLTEAGVYALISVLSKCPLLDQLYVTGNTVSKAKKEVREQVIEAWVKSGRLRDQLKL